MKQFNVGVDANGRPLGSLPSPDVVNSVSLGVATAKSVTIPSGALYARFKATTDFYANFATTATVPGDVTNGSASTLNPDLIALENTDTLSVISPAASVVTVAFYV